MRTATTTFPLLNPARQQPAFDGVKEISGFDLADREAWVKDWLVAGVLTGARICLPLDAPPQSGGCDLPEKISDPLTKLHGKCLAHQ